MHRLCQDLAILVLITVKPLSAVFQGVVHVFNATQIQNVSSFSVCEANTIYPAGGEL